eukprot:8404883-Pyramimonas_sp.AAC.1
MIDAHNERGVHSLGSLPVCRAITKRLALPQPGVSRPTRPLVRAAVRVQSPLAAVDPTSALLAPVEDLAGTRHEKRGPFTRRYQKQDASRRLRARRRDGVSPKNVFEMLQETLAFKMLYRIT